MILTCDTRPKEKVFVAVVVVFVGVATVGVVASTLELFVECWSKKG